MKVCAMEPHRSASTATLYDTPPNNLSNRSMR